MIRVQVRPNETLEAALRRFKRQCNYAGIFRLAKKYNSYEKRSDRRRREDRERIRNIQRAQRKTRVKGRPRGMKRSKVKATTTEEGVKTDAPVAAKPVEVAPSVVSPLAGIPVVDATPAAATPAVAPPVQPLPQVGGSTGPTENARLGESVVAKAGPGVQAEA